MKACVIIVLGLICSLSFSQTEVFEKTVALNGKRVDIDAELVDQIKVTNWNKNEVGVKITYSINNGELNDALEISLDENGSKIRLEVELDERSVDNSDFRDCDGEHSMNWGKNGRRNSVCLDVLVEIQIPQNIELDVESVIGDLMLEGSYKALRAKTVTGDIELYWPESQGAEIEIKTVMGGIYTNHDFQSKTKDKGLPLISAHELQASLGKGGNYISLETVTSDIYFKKSK